MATTASSVSTSVDEIVAIINSYIQTSGKIDPVSKKKHLFDLYETINAVHGGAPVYPAMFGLKMMDGLQPYFMHKVPCAWWGMDAAQLDDFVSKLTGLNPKLYPPGCEVVILRPNSDPRKLSDWLKCFIVGIWRINKDGVPEKINV